MRVHFVAIDVMGNQIVTHVSIRFKQGALAWRKSERTLGLPKALLTDNGSENLGAFAELLKAQQVPHYFARPYTPENKPHVECKKSIVSAVQRVGTT